MRKLSERSSNFRNELAALFLKASHEFAYGSTKTSGISVATR